MGGPCNTPLFSYIAVFRSNRMRILRSGFDTIDIAIKGALPKATLGFLREMKEEAAQTQEDAPILVGSDTAFVASSGLKGGYAFRVDTGPVGEILAIKDNPNPTQWNLFVSIHAATLASLGLSQAVENVWTRLNALSADILDHSVNRTDYAIDFLAPDFEPDLSRFVTQARSKKRPIYSGPAVPPDDLQPQAVFSGRRLETVMIGKMPGRQVVLYDKRREAIDKQKWFWFRAWNLDRHDPTARVWRVEIRAGKRELKGRWGVSSLTDVLDTIGDVYRATLADIRYVAAHQTDSNVHRQRLDPLWAAAQAHIAIALKEYSSGLCPVDVLEIEREKAIRMYHALVLGNVAGLAASLGYSVGELERDLPTYVKGLIQDALNDDAKAFHAKVERGQWRMRTRPLEPEL